MKFFIALLIALFLTSCFPSTVKRDSGALKSPSGESYHWPPGSFPIPVAIHPGVSDERTVAVELALQQWNVEVGYQVFVAYDAPNSFPMWEENGYFPYQGYISVEEGPPGVDPTYNVRRNAYALVHLRPGHAELRGEIHSVQILMGDHLKGVNATSRVALHELGHALGLEHDKNDPTSIMWFSATASEEQSVQVEDLEYVRSQMTTGGEFLNVSSSVCF